MKHGFVNFSLVWRAQKGGSEGGGQKQVLQHRGDGAWPGGGLNEPGAKLMPHLAALWWDVPLWSELAARTIVKSVPCQEALLCLMEKETFALCLQ